MTIMTVVDPKRIVTEIFHAALRSVDPYVSVTQHAGGLLDRYRKEGYGKLLVAGFGKASCPMAKAVEDVLSEIICRGFVITKYGHCEGYDLNKIGVYEAGHPLPDENGIRGTKEILNLLKGVDESVLVLCLISGGGSALLVSPYGGVSLAEKQAITDLLLKAGADIHELNTVRKHLSAVKGGRLAEIAYPAGIISLIISDVIGDRLDVIASGPTSPDETTYRDALDVITKYGLEGRSPRSVLELLKKGAVGAIPETPKKGSLCFDRVDNMIIAGNGNALQAAKEKAESFGFDADIFSSELTGDARDAGKLLADKALGMKKAGGFGRPLCLISGGETTVRVKGGGLGGRNMELALAFAIEIEGLEGITLLSAGTDGTDGPTDAAGAVVDGRTVPKARSLGLDPRHYLEDNDSYHFFQSMDDLLITGPTGTNVMDMQVILIR